MRLRDYKALLVADRKAAMLFDLTERHPRGPEAKLRARDYEPHDSYYNNVGAVLVLKESSIPATAEGSPATGGWNPREIYEIDPCEWQLKRELECIEVPEGIGRGSTYRAEDGMQMLFPDGGSALTRRSRRTSQRIYQAKRWVKENIKTAIYSVSLGYGTQVHVHGDSDEQAFMQYEMFLKGGVTGIPDAREGYDNSARYVKPADSPTALMTLNSKFVNEMDRQVTASLASIEKLKKEVEAMQAARELVYSYSVNMAATYGIEDDDDDEVAA